MNVLRFASVFASLALCFVSAPQLAAQDAPAPVADEAPQLDLPATLARTVLDEHQPLEEIQTYLLAHVPHVPEVASVGEWKLAADRIRRQMFERVIYRGEAAAWRDAELDVEYLDVIEAGSGYRIRKLRFEALPGLWIPALLYEPTELAGRVPAILNVNGHDGQGKSVEYKQIRCINQAKRGMLALNVEWYGMGQLRTDDFLHYRSNQLDLCGTSGLAPFYLALKRGLDVLLAHEHADPDRVAVTGLSGGGWQTIFISSLDERVTLSVPVAGYESLASSIPFHDIGDSEQAPVDFATVADYAHLTAMRAPRPTLLIYNAEDQCCFKADHSLEPLLEAARPIYQLYGKPDRLRWHVNYDPGTHNYELDNRQALYRMLGDQFYPGDETFDANEIDVAAELKSAEELAVDLPADNADFHTLAVQLAQGLPRNAELPSDVTAAESWIQEGRQRLAALVRYQPLSVVDARPVSRDQYQGYEAAQWRLQVARSRRRPDRPEVVAPPLTIPAVGIARAESEAAAIVLADGGRAAAAEQVQALLDAGTGVLVMDPLFFGEAAIQGGAAEFLYPLQISVMGQRPLGVQAAQVVAAADWVRRVRASGPVQVVAVGPRSSTIGLVAAALDTDAIGSVEVYQPLGSLSQVIEENRPVTASPELFCFGLLAEFDVKQIAALAAPRPLGWHGADERAETELAELRAWYATLGAPLQAN